MLIYNSRKRREWTEQQENKLLAVLEQAHQAAAQGAATEEQLRLLRIEQVVDTTERERAAKGGTFQRAKSYWYSMYSNERPAENGSHHTQTAVNADSDESNSELGVLKAVKEATGSQASPSPGYSRTLQAIKHSHDKVEFGKTGGPFDKASVEVTDRAKNVSNSWLGWIKGK